MKKGIILPSPILRLTGEDIGYFDNIALQEISVSIDAGEKVAILGPSGAGKTTLLKRLYQLQPDNCAFIHQQYALVQQLSVFHNIYMGRLDCYPLLHNLYNLIRPSKKRLAEIQPILQSLGLQEKLSTRVGELSGGQQQRVAVGRALYQGGQILMADEPVSSLDSVQQFEVMSIITRTQKTVISSLHSLELAHRFFSRMIAIRDKSIFFDLPVSKVDKLMLKELYQG